MKQEVHLCKASLACQVRTNIRWKEDISYQTLVKIFKKEIAYDAFFHKQYLLSFFEECYPSLIKKFMAEQAITRQEILDIFRLLPNFGETNRFREALNNGEF